MLDHDANNMQSFGDIKVLDAFWLKPFMPSIKRFIQLKFLRESTSLKKAVSAINCLDASKEYFSSGIQIKRKAKHISDGVI